MNALAGQTGQGSIIVVFKVVDFFSGPALNVLPSEGAFEKECGHRNPLIQKNGGGPA